METQLNYSVCRMVSSEQWVPVHPGSDSFGQKNSAVGCIRRDSGF